jgi:hypothetical protein
LVDKWDAEGVKWAVYEDSIKDMVFDTKEVGLAEVKRLSDILKPLMKLEESLQYG